MAASREQLIEAEEVGDKIADSIIDYFADEQNRRIIERLRAAGLQFEAQRQTPASEALRGLSIVISGSFRDHSRDELKAMIEAHGGKNLAAVSANTSYLLAGDKIGPAKLQKAQKLGIRIISEDDFYSMIADKMVGGIAEETADTAGTAVPQQNPQSGQPQNTPDTGSGGEQPQQGTLFQVPTITEQ